MPVSVNAITMEIGDSVPDTTAAQPKLKSALSNFMHTPPPPSTFVQPDMTNTNTGRSESASAAWGRKNQRGNH